MLVYLSVIEDESKETIYCMTPTWKLTVTHEISHWDMMVAFFVGRLVYLYITAWEVFMKIISFQAMW